VRIHAISVRSDASRVRSTASRVDASNGPSATIAPQRSPSRCCSNLARASRRFTKPRTTNDGQWSPQDTDQAMRGTSRLRPGGSAANERTMHNVHTHRSRTRPTTTSDPISSIRSPQKRCHTTAPIAIARLGRPGAAATAGLSRITFHDLPHCYAVVTLKAGVSPKALSERIGHANVGFFPQT
jgi:hypothetical protein